ncbi:hypothetical protein JB92DRAFT_2828674 [Gautieria morchelliformis]|nr:hypothetical protein JB92DRAFT_2828674 [Gautieria morchelliformis]
MVLWGCGPQALTTAPALPITPVLLVLPICTTAPLHFLGDSYDLQWAGGRLREITLFGVYTVAVRIKAKMYHKCRKAQAQSQGLGFHNLEAQPIWWLKLGWVGLGSGSNQAWLGPAQAGAQAQSITRSVEPVSLTATEWREQFLVQKFFPVHLYPEHFGMKVMVLGKGL